MHTHPTLDSHGGGTTTTTVGARADGQGEVRENFSSWVLLEPAPAAAAPAAAAVDAE